MFLKLHQHVDEVRSDNVVLPSVPHRFAHDSREERREFLMWQYIAEQIVQRWHELLELQPYDVL